MLNTCPKRMKHPQIRIKVMMRTIVCLILVCLLLGCGGSGDGPTDSINTDNGTTDPFDDNGAIDPFDIIPSSIETFVSVNGDICREDGKPIIRLFSTTWCLHCQWVGDTFDAVVQMYVEDDFIVAHHWELDIGDDILTSQVEQAVPDDEMAIFF